jgi:hypothetical protein
MATARTHAVQRVSRALEFRSASEVGSFLLTCLEVASLARGTPVFDECLNRIRIRKQPPYWVHLRVMADVETVATLMRIAAANGGTAHKLEEMTAAYEEVELAKFLRRIRLQPLSAQVASDRLLLALWGFDTKQLREALLVLNDIATARCEVAFIEAGTPDMPSFLIRLQGLTHPDAVLSWAAGSKGKVEVFVPYQAEVHAGFYVRHGYRFPVAGLDTLADVQSELVLLRPTEKGAAQWVVFAEKQLHFFRKMHEVLGAEVSATESPLLELREGQCANRLPLELALVGDGEGTPLRLWQLDRVIDLQRQKLNELERRRLRLASGKFGDVYFAYRFEQRGADRLNPLLIRFLQQRLGILAEYEYTWCQPADGPGYHLLVAQRTERQLGFGVQLADAVYFQPEEYRRWGVNLYLPVGRRLVPGLGVDDAVPLLQQLLEKTQTHDASAILWDDLGAGKVLETRVLETQPLLSQFRVLNAFQRAEARQVAEQTRKTLIDQLRQTRESLTLSCRDIEQDILTYIGARCEEIETTYKDLNEKVVKAESELVCYEPEVARVADFIEHIPNLWADFVRAVVDLNRQLGRDRQEAYENLRNEYVYEHRRLRAIAACHRDLAAQIQLAVDKVAIDHDALAKDLSQAAETLRQGREVNAKLFGICVEIRDAFEKLAVRLKAIAAVQQKADRIQTAIDSVDQQEREARERLKRLETIREQMRDREDKLKQTQAEVQAKEIDSVSKAAELTRAEDALVQRLRDAAARLQRLEEDLQRIVAESRQTDELFAAIDEEAEMLRRRAGIVDRWQTHAAAWADYLNAQYGGLHQKDGQARAKATPVPPPKG